MRCPFCGECDDRVVDSRVSERGKKIRRCRECQSCDQRFTTYERIADVFPKIVKRDGSREEFDREKLRRGIELASTKRPVSVDEIDRVVENVEHRLQQLGQREVESDWVGSAVTTELQKLDPVAYIRFASVYHAFSDIQEFLEELRGFESEDSDLEEE
jgi:transcriptional repressor NrdR